MHNCKICIESLLKATASLRPTWNWWCISIKIEIYITLVRSCFSILSLWSNGVSYLFVSLWSTSAAGPYQSAEGRDLWRPKAPFPHDCRCFCFYSLFLIALLLANLSVPFKPIGLTLPPLLSIVQSPWSVRTIPYHYIRQCLLGSESLLNSLLHYLG